MGVNNEPCHKHSIPLWHIHSQKGIFDLILIPLPYLQLLHAGQQKYMSNHVILDENRQGFHPNALHFGNLQIGSLN